MSKLPRRIQYAGLLILLGSAFAPTLDVRAHPATGTLRGRPHVTEIGIAVTGARQVPAAVFADAWRDGLAEGDLMGTLWRGRAWYPFLLALPWGLAFLCLLGARAGQGRRRLVGALAWGFCGAIAAFEAVYLRSDYASFLPGRLGHAETLAVWFFVTFLLFYRRRGHRRMGAVEATVGAQALLGVLHLLTLPSTMARGWIGVYGNDLIVESLLTNFPPAFWLGCAGTLLVALPAYVGRTHPPVKNESGPPVGGPLP